MKVNDMSTVPPRASSGRKAGESMDPRIRRRRIEVRREAGRRRLRLLGGTAAVLALLGGAYGATRSPLLDVEDVRVTGAVGTSRDGIAAAGLRPGRPMTDIDPGAAARRLEALPWVSRARVERQWPDTVSVRIVERSATAAAALPEGGWALADAHGRVLAWVAERPAGLVELRGAERPGPPGATLGPPTRAALEVLAALSLTPGARVGTVDLGFAGDLDLTLAAGPVVRFGAPVQVEEKVTALRTIAEKVSLAHVAAIDVRVPSSPALTRRGDTK